MSAVALFLLAQPLVAGGAAADGAPPRGTDLFGVRPAHAGETTLAHGHLAYALAAGGRVSDAIVITNRQTQPSTLRVYPADMVSARGGALAPAQQNSPRRHTGAWLQLSRNEVALQPGASQLVPFELRVPDGIPAASYPGAVVVSTITGAAKSGVAVETRAALLVDLRVLGEVRPKAGVRLHADRGDGEVRFRVPIRNRGNVLYTVRGSVKVFRGRHRLATLPLGPANIYVIPGGQAELRTTWDAPALGRLRAVADVRATIDKHPPLDVHSNALGLTLVPWRLVSSAGAAIAALAAAAWLTRTPRRRRRAERRAARQIVRDLRAGRGVAPGSTRAM